MHHIAAVLGQQHACLRSRRLSGRGQQAGSLTRLDASFNAIVCNADSHTWNQTLDLTVMLPEVLGPK